jgi:hypothetical protein
MAIVVNDSSGWIVAVVVFTLQNFCKSFEISVRRLHRGAYALCFGRGQEFDL